MTTLKKTFSAVLAETSSSWRNLLDKRLKPLGLSQAKWRTLLHLSLAKSPLTQTELATRTGIETATLVGILDRLTKAGWVERKAVENDRRSKTVHLTEKSRTTISTILAIAEQLRDDLLAEINEDELQLCMKVLKQIKAKTEELSSL